MSALVWDISPRIVQPIKDRNTKQPRVAKVKGAEKEKDSLAKGEQLKAEEQRPTSVSGSPARPKVEDPIPNGDGGQPHGRSAQGAGESAATLINEATVLLKTLRSVKAVKVKQVNYEPDCEHRPVALLDGGATHGLRMAEPWERGALEPVQVELASGSTWLYRHGSHKTLLSLTQVEPIVPLHRLVSMGFRIEWSSKGCRIFHPSRGHPVLAPGRLSDDGTWRSPSALEGDGEDRWILHGCE